jgi:uridine kinase
VAARAGRRWAIAPEATRGAGVAVGSRPMSDRFWPDGRPLVIGVAGGSGSGKTTITEAIIEVAAPEPVTLVQHDAYYRHRPDLTFEQRTAVNYDHPDSLETDLMVEHLRTLVSGGTAEIPVYDFPTHLRTSATTSVTASAVILVEGILVLAEPGLRDLMDLRIFVDTDADVRLARRARRDVAERGRSVQSVLDQWEATVRPMYLEFVEPSRRHADLIIPEGYNDRAVRTLQGMLRDALGGR